MQITKFELSGGIVVELIMPREQGDRLEGTCFRGNRCRQAGNFHAWGNFREFLLDPEARELLVPHFEKLVAEAQVQRTHRIELRFSRDIGWESVVDAEDLSVDELVKCDLRDINKRASALFLPENLIEASQTDTVTMVLRMKHVEHWRFVICTMYPGYDCGELIGNMTESKKLVWLPWSNRGGE